MIAHEQHITGNQPRATTRKRHGQLLVSLSGLLALLSGGGCIWGIDFDPPWDWPPIDSGKVIERDGVRLELDYVGNRRWSYELTTNLPTPCHSLSLTVQINESLPEVVRFIAQTVAPADGQVCPQVVTPVTRVGSFNASREATFELQIAP